MELGAFFTVKHLLHALTLFIQHATWQSIRNETDTEAPPHHPTHTPPLYETLLARTLYTCVSSPPPPQLVDGVLTEDSDAFLYGARAVYRGLSTTERVGHMMFVTSHAATVVHGFDESSFSIHNSSLEDATKLKFVPFCSP